MSVPTHARTRFGLRALLFAVAFVASVLGVAVQAYRHGQQQGYELGYDAALNERLSEADLLTIEYHVDDVLAQAYPDDSPDISVGLLLETLTAKAKPETWATVGGYGTVDVDQDEYGETILVVNNSINTHLEVSRILDDIRGAAPGIADRSFVKHLYAADSAED